MKKFYLLLAILVTFGCATKGSVQNDKKTIQKQVVAVKVESNSTVLSSGRLDTWYRVDTRLVEGMMYEVTLEIPRVIEAPLFIPANLLDMRPIEYLQRDLYGRYITKYRELKSAEKEQVAEASAQN